MLMNNKLQIKNVCTPQTEVKIWNHTAHNDNWLWGWIFIIKSFTTGYVYLYFWILNTYIKRIGIVTSKNDSKSARKNIGILNKKWEFSRVNYVYRNKHRNKVSPLKKKLKKLND